MSSGVQAFLMDKPSVSCVNVYVFVPSSALNETWYQYSDSMCEFQCLFCISLPMSHCWGGVEGLTDLQPSLQRP